MRIITQQLGLDIEDEAVCVHLAQVSTTLDEATKRFRNAQNHWNLIKTVLSAFSSTADPAHVNFLVFPEISVPYAHILDVVNTVNNSFPKNSVTILGIELITVEECEFLSSRLDIKSPEVRKASSGRFGGSMRIRASPDAK